MDSLGLQPEVRDHTLTKSSGGATQPSISQMVTSRLRQPVKMLPGFSNQQDSLVFSIRE